MVKFTIPLLNVFEVTRFGRKYINWSTSEKIKPKARNALTKGARLSYKKPRKHGGKKHAMRLLLIHVAVLCGTS